MHVMRHLPISGLSLPSPPKIHRNIIIIKRVPVTSFQFPQVIENCPPKTDTAVQEHDTAPTVSRPVNSVKLYCCSTCMKGFCEEIEWKAHVEEHSKTKSLICKMCCKGYIKESAYERHLRRHNPRKPYACNMCGKSYSQSRMLSIHLLRHPNAKPFRCTVCTLGFLSQELLETHLEIHTNRGIFCNICERTFVNKDHFDGHFCGYSGRKPIICGICDGVYFCSTSYNNHVQTHTKEDLLLVRNNNHV